MKKGKFRILSDGMLTFYCEGCKREHGIYVDKNKPVYWEFNNDYNKPTLTPSILVTMPNVGICHSFITDGKIQYLTDCHHELAGQTVEMITEPT